MTVGPEGDPAGIGRSASAVRAMQHIAETETLFVSRGDDSGTHHTELQLWDAAGIDPYGHWYFELGQGMQKTLDVASEKQAYVLVDRATWLFNRQNVSLKECFQGGPELITKYSLIPVNPAKHRGINRKAAEQFVSFVTSVAGRSLIKNHQVEGQSLFKMPISDQ